MVEVVKECKKHIAECPRCWSDIGYSKDDIVSYDLVDWSSDTDDAPFKLEEYKLKLLEGDCIICPRCMSHFIIGPCNGSIDVVDVFNDELKPAKNRAEFEEKCKNLGIYDQVLHIKYDLVKRHFWG
jgi:hypothetical protein